MRKQEICSQLKFCWFPVPCASGGQSAVYGLCQEVKIPMFYTLRSLSCFLTLVPLSCSLFVCPGGDGVPSSRLWMAVCLFWWVLRRGILHRHRRPLAALVI